ncbi:hypothetical protein ES707_09935 [subsurface metagenome]
MCSTICIRTWPTIVTSLDQIVDLDAVHQGDVLDELHPDLADDRHADRPASRRRRGGPGPRPRRAASGPGRRSSRRSASSPPATWRTWPTSSTSCIRTWPTIVTPMDSTQNVKGMMGDFFPWAIAPRPERETEPAGRFYMPAKKALAAMRGRHHNEDDKKEAGAKRLLHAGGKTQTPRATVPAGAPRCPAKDTAMLNDKDSRRTKRGQGNSDRFFPLGDCSAAGRARQWAAPRYDHGQSKSRGPGRRKTAWPECRRTVRAFCPEPFMLSAKGITL